jgi:hypothetical protein
MSMTLIDPEVLERVQNDIDKELEFKKGYQSSELS